MEQIRVRNHYTFWLAGRPRSVLQDRDIVGVRLVRIPICRRDAIESVRCYQRATKLGVPDRFIVGGLKLARGMAKSAQRR